MNIYVHFKTAAILATAGQWGSRKGLEVSGTALLYPSQGGNWVLQEGGILLQESSSVQTTLDPDALFNWQQSTRVREALQGGAIAAHWHTHPKGVGTSPSTGDLQQYSAWRSQYNRFFSLIYCEGAVGALAHTGGEWETFGSVSIAGYSTGGKLVESPNWLLESLGAAKFDRFDDSVFLKDLETLVLKEKPPVYKSKNLNTPAKGTAKSLKEELQPFFLPSGSGVEWEEDDFSDDPFTSLAQYEREMGGFYR
jgi:hypothetical protein